jgi:hypothetical protein
MFVSMSSILPGLIAQQAGELDLTLEKRWSSRGNSELIQGLPNDQFLLAGSNLSILTEPKNSIPWGYQPVVRCNSDGSLDPSFRLFNGNIGKPSLNALRLKSLITDEQGSILLGGHFNVRNFNSDVPTEINHLARFSMEGRLDETFNLGPGPDGEITVIDVLNDRKIWIAGRFFNIDGQRLPYIALLDHGGNPIESFKIGNGFDQYVKNGFADDEGRMVVVGAFEAYGEHPVNGIARINQDGSFDDTFLTNGTFDQKPSEIIEGPNKTIFVAGNFNTFQNSPVPPLVQLNEQGELVDAFNIPSQLKLIEVKAMVMGEEKNYLYVEASLINDFDVPELRLFRLNLDSGALDDGFYSNMNPFAGVATSLLVQPGLGLLMNGGFQEINGVFRRDLARILTSDQQVSIPVLRHSVGSGILNNGDGFNIAVSVNAHPPASFQWFFNGIPIPSENGPVFQRRFANSSHEGRYHVVISNEEGELITDPVDITVKRGNPGSVDQDFQPELILRDVQVNSILVQENQSVLIAGLLNPRGGLPIGETIPNMVRFLSDGTLDPSFNQGAGPDGLVNCLVELPWGDLLIGGSFQQYNQIEVPGYVVTDKNGHLLGNDQVPLSGTLLLTLSNLEVRQISTAVLDEEGGVYLAAQFGGDSNLKRKVIRLNPDASLDLGFTPLEQDRGTFRNLHWQSDHTLWVYHDHGMMWHFDETGQVLQAPEDFGVEGLRRGLTRFDSQSDGTTLILGKLPSENDSRTIERWGPGSGLDSEFSSYYPESTFGWAHALGVASDDSFYIGSRLGNTGDSNLIRMFPDGSLDERFSAKNQVVSVDHLAVLENGDLLVVGAFSRTATGVEGNIARVFGVTSETARRIDFGISLDKGGIEISFTTDPGQRYQLLTRASLIDGEWELVQERMGAGDESSFTLERGNQPQAFFRVRKMED